LERAIVSEEGKEAVPEKGLLKAPSIFTKILGRARSLEVLPPVDSERRKGRILQLNRFVADIKGLMSQEIAKEKREQQIRDCLTSIDAADAKSLYHRTWESRKEEAGEDLIFGEKHVADDLSLLVSYTQGCIEQLHFSMTFEDFAIRLIQAEGLFYDFQRLSHRASLRGVIVDIERTSRADVFLEEMEKRHVDLTNRVTELVKAMNLSSTTWNAKQLEILNKKGLVMNLFSLQINVDQVNLRSMRQSCQDNLVLKDEIFDLQKEADALVSRSAPEESMGLCRELRERVGQTLGLYTLMPTASISQLLKIDSKLLDFQQQYQIATGVKDITVSPLRIFLGSPQSSKRDPNERRVVSFLSPQPPPQTPVRVSTPSIGSSFTTPKRSILSSGRDPKSEARSSSSSSSTPTPVSGLTHSDVLDPSKDKRVESSGLDAPTERTKPLYAFISAITALSSGTLDSGEKKSRVREELRSLEPDDCKYLYRRTWKPHEGKEGGDHHFGETHIADDLSLLIGYATDRIAEVTP
jgi:hypothetical protein